MLLERFRSKNRWAVPSNPRDITRRTQLLNYLVREHGYTRYLEIGVRNPRDNFDHVKVEQKQGVDPASNTTFRMTSDAFFAQLPEGERFDLVFVDGLHLAEQVEKDVANSLRHLAPGGTIVLHDCNPPTERAQVENYVEGTKWNGTVWKAIAALRGTRRDLFVGVIDMDEGCGVVRPGRQVPYAPWPPPGALDYAYLENNRRELLNLISLPEFLRIDEEYRRSASQR